MWPFFNLLGNAASTVYIAAILLLGVEGLRWMLNATFEKVTRRRSLLEPLTQKLPTPQIVAAIAALWYGGFAAFAVGNDTIAASRGFAIGLHAMAVVCFGLIAFCFDLFARQLWNEYSGIERPIALFFAEIAVYLLSWFEPRIGAGLGIAWQYASVVIYVLLGRQ